MTRKILFTLLLITLYTGASFSQEENKPAVQNKTERYVNKQITELEKEHGELSKKLKKIDEAQEAVDKAMGGVPGLGWFRGEGDVAKNEKLKKLIDEFNETHVSIDKGRDKAKNLQKEITRRDTKADPFKNKLATDAVRILVTDFTDLKINALDVGRSLDKIERKLDKAVIGHYLQDKIGLLLNSNAICKARKRCVTKGEKEIPSEDIRKELFPESNPENIRKGDRSYYEKAKKNRKRAGQQ